MCVYIYVYIYFFYNSGGLVTKLCPTLVTPLDFSPSGFFVHGFPQARNTGVDCHFLLQEIFPTQGSNLHLLH